MIWELCDSNWFAHCGGIAPWQATNLKGRWSDVRPRAAKEKQLTSDTKPIHKYFINSFVLCSHKCEYRRSIYLPRHELPQECGKIFRRIPQKLFPVFARVRMQAPHAFVQTFIAQNVSCMYWFCAGGGGYLLAQCPAELLRCTECCGVKVTCCYLLCPLLTITCGRAHARLHTHTHMHTPTHTPTHPPTHTHTHTHPTHARTHARTPTRTHACTRESAQHTDTHFTTQIWFRERQKQVILLTTSLAFASVEIQHASSFHAGSARRCGCSACDIPHIT